MDSKTIVGLLRSVILSANGDLTIWQAKQDFLELAGAPIPDDFLPHPEFEIKNDFIYNKTAGKSSHILEMKASERQSAKPKRPVSQYRVNGYGNGVNRSLPYRRGVNQGGYKAPPKKKTPKIGEVNIKNMKLVDKKFGDIVKAQASTSSSLPEPNRNDETKPNEPPHSLGLLPKAKKVQVINEVVIKPAPPPQQPKPLPKPHLPPKSEPLSFLNKKLVVRMPVKSTAAPVQIAAPITPKSDDVDSDIEIIPLDDDIASSDESVDFEEEQRKLMNGYQPLTPSPQEHDVNTTLYSLTQENVDMLLRHWKSMSDTPISLPPGQITPEDDSDAKSVKEMSTPKPVPPVDAMQLSPPPATTSYLNTDPRVSVSPPRPSEPRPSKPRPSEPRPSDPRPSDPRPSDPRPSTSAMPIVEFTAPDPRVDPNRRKGVYLQNQIVGSVNSTTDYTDSIRENIWCLHEIELDYDWRAHKATLEPQKAITAPPGVVKEEVPTPAPKPGQITLPASTADLTADKALEILTNPVIGTLLVQMASSMAAQQPVAEAPKSNPDNHCRALVPFARSRKISESSASSSSSPHRHGKAVKRRRRSSSFSPRRRSRSITPKRKHRHRRRSRSGSESPPRRKSRRHPYRSRRRRSSSRDRGRSSSRESRERYRRH